MGGWWVIDIGISSMATMESLIMQRLNRQLQPAFFFSWVLQLLTGAMPLTCQSARCSAALVVLRGDGIAQCGSHGGTMSTHEVDLQKVHTKIDA